MYVTNSMFQRFHILGYENITINLWQETRLYVNIKGIPAFYYNLLTGCSINSGTMLSRDIFLSARTLCGFLRCHKTELIEELGDGKYHSDKEQPGVSKHEIKNKNGLSENL